jgi:hypothetical protein
MAEGKDTGPEKNLPAVVGELRALADQLEAGQIMVGGVALAVGKAVALKVKHTMVDNRLKCTVGLTVDLPTPTDLATARLGPQTRANHPERTGSGKNKKARPYEAKQLKKKLSHLWRDINTAIQAGQPPAAALQRDFLALGKEYGRTAEEPWRPLWQDALLAMETLFGQAREGNFPAAAQTLDVINDQMKSCHKRFK